MTNIYIYDDGKGFTLPKGFIPEKGQKIIVVCPDCGAEYEVPLGGYINLYDTSSDDMTCICPKCKYEFSEYIELSEFFDCVSLNMIYSKGYGKLIQQLNLNCDVDTSLDISKIIGAFQLQGVMHCKDIKLINTDEYIVFMDTDIETAKHILYKGNNINRDKILAAHVNTVDGKNIFTVKKVKDIKLGISIDYMDKDDIINTSGI